MIRIKLNIVKAQIMGLQLNYWLPIDFEFHYKFCLYKEILSTIQVTFSYPCINPPPPQKKLVDAIL